jgi:hypothetical protein
MLERMGGEFRFFHVCNGDIQTETL